jgi:DNA polymerase
MSVKTLKQYLEYLKFSGIQDIFILRNEVTEKARGLDSQSSGKAALLEAHRQQIINCTNCRLNEGRLKLVYGQGNPDAKLMLIGEGPGAEENNTGQAFVGKAGQLLTKMLLAIDLEREEVFIANIVKCRPPDNRDPQEDERRSCLPYLLKQIEIIKPQILLLLGKVSAGTILETQETLGQMREKIHTFQGIPTYVSYHPSALLRNPDWKRPAWEDLKRVRAHYLSLPAKP